MRRFALTAAFLLTASCTSLQPAYVRPTPPVPSSWPSGSVDLAGSEAALAELRYTEVFRDPRLQGLIEMALANNRNLRASVADIRSARAQYRIQRSSLLPNVSAGIGATAGYRGAESTGGAGSVGGSGQGGIGGSGSYQNYTADIGFTGFEIDVFGRIESLSDSALNEYLATESAARSVRLTLVGELATAWSTYAADLELRQIAQATADSASQSVELTSARLQSGVAPRTDLRQAQIILETANADLEAAKAAVAQDRNAVSLLVGQPIDDSALPGALSGLQNSFGMVPSGLQSSVLLRRPDIIQAEYRLIAANARIGAARATMFPQISLTGLLGVASNALGSLFTGNAFTGLGTADAALPIFDGGARLAGVAQSQAARDALLATYEYSIQSAFREVADALARQATIGAQIAANERFVAAAEDNYELTQARYVGGVDTYLASLDAQRSLYSARRQLVAVQLEGAANLVNLYVAIGGDPQLASRAIEPPPAA